MENYNIIPVHFVAENRKAESAADAIIGFATQMDSDMNNYFKAVLSEDTTSEIVKQIVGMIDSNALSADDISDIFRALGRQDCYIAGKMFTTQDIANHIEDNYSAQVHFSQDILDEIAGYVNVDSLEDCDDSDWNAIAAAISDSSATVLISDIVWDVDEEENDAEIELPKEIKLPLSKLRYNVDIADYLSDNYGYCVESYSVDAVEN